MLRFVPARFSSARFALALIGAAALASCGRGAGSAQLMPPVASGDAGLASPSIAVTTLADSGKGSLRAAIVAANARAASSTITFTVRGTIRLASALPAIVRAVTIDGTSAPGYKGAPVVELDANHRGGLVFATGSGGSKLLGMAVDDAIGSGVTLRAGPIALDYNYIGLNLKGAAFGNGGDGISVVATSSNDRIGGNPANASGAVSNVISGNAGNGIALYGSSNDTIAANRIGTNPLGTRPVANRANGIWITAGSKNDEIGGKVFVDGTTHQTNNPTGNKGTVTPVFVVPPLGNLVSGNRQDGIRIDAGSSGNSLNGNFVGTTADGNGALANRLDGVRINGAPNNVLAGCKFKNNPFVYYNVIAGNVRNGLQITNSDAVSVQGNFFGIGANNTTVVANGGDGILIDGSSKNTQVGGVIPLGNVSAGNGKNGIEVAGTASGFITFNTFGGLLAFKGAAPNANDGILITSTGGSQTIRTNVFSGNRQNGVEIAGDASGVTVDPNIVGLNTKGDGVLPNGNDGVRVAGSAHGNVIGGYTNSVIPQNTFSGNGGYGVEFVGSSHDNSLFNSFVGTNVLGTAALGNGRGGIYAGGRANHILIGGPQANAQPRRNLVSGNAGNGVTLDNGSSYVSAIGNWIGLDRFGAKKLPNSGSAIVVMPGSRHDTIVGNKT